MSIKIVHCTVVEYQSHLRRPFKTARKTINGNINYLIMVVAERAGQQVIGVGESAPRGVHMTADPTAAVWDFLSQGADLLGGLGLDDTSPEACIAAIRAGFAPLEALARQLGADVVDDSPGGKPFRGSIAGMETAVLDACARLFDMPLGRFLGGLREDIAVTATTTSAGADFARYRDQLASAGKRYPACPSSSAKRISN